MSRVRRAASHSSSGGRRAAPDEHEGGGLRALGDVLGDGHADAAEAAGDQVDAARLPRRVEGRRQHHRFQRAQPTLAPPQHDDVGGPLGIDLGLDRRDEACRGGRPGLREIDVDRHRVDVAELAGDDPHVAVEQRPLGQQRIGRVEGVDAGRDQRQPHRLGDRREGAREEEHAGVVASDRLAVGDHVVVGGQPEPAPTARRPEGGGVDDGAGQHAVGGERFDQRHPVIGASRVDLEAAAGMAEEAIAERDRHDAAAAAEVGGEGGGQRVAVADDHDGRGHRALGERSGDRTAPGRGGEPVVDEGPLAQHALRRGARRVGGVRLDPEALVVERVGGERHAVALLVGEQRGRIELDARLPRPADGGEGEGDVGRHLPRVAQGRGDGRRWGRGHPRQPGQRAARSDLE